MELLVEYIQFPYVQRALLASAMVGVLCGVLGVFIVLRNMALIGDALSHAVLPGVVIGFMVAGYSIMGFFIGSVMAGLGAAILITWIQRNVRTREDAAIGIVFTAMFAAGVIGISYLTQQEGVHLDLKDFLFGNMLGIRDEDLYLTASVLGFTVLCVVVFYRYLFAATFGSIVAETTGISVSTVHYFLMLLLSFAVVASLQSVGVILVVAMLITPASTADLLTNRLGIMIGVSALLGLLSAVIGIIVAILWETTPGPAMTLVATGFYGLAALFSPRRGLVTRWFRRRGRRQRILREDILKQAFRLAEKGGLSEAALSEKLQMPVNQLTGSFAWLRRKGLFQKQRNNLRLTDAGKEVGLRLIKAHRLWETYLVQEMGLNPDQIHDHAEDFEHLILDEALLEEVDRKLGFPEVDPHGSPIPGREQKG